VDTVIEKIAWRRGGVANDFVGSLRAGSDGIRLTGRDQGGLDVALSIPPGEVERVYASPAGSDQVVVELGDAEPVLLHRLYPGPLNAHLLARQLRGSLLLPRLHVPGG
jgi:hypothetical protein